MRLNLRVSEDTGRTIISCPDLLGWSIHADNPDLLWRRLREGYAEAQKRNVHAAQTLMIDGAEKQVGLKEEPKPPRQSEPAVKEEPVGVNVMPEPRERPSVPIASVPSVTYPGLKRLIRNARDKLERFHVHADGDVMWSGEEVRQYAVIVLAIEALTAALDALPDLETVSADEANETRGNYESDVSELRKKLKTSELRAAKFEEDCVVFQASEDELVGNWFEVKELLEGNPAEALECLRRGPWGDIDADA